ncbi:MAG: glycoside hydrolase family 43 protein [Planctomycetota bacterium]
MLRITAIVASLFASATAAQTNLDTIHPGEHWPDTDGVHINAHGGGVLHHDGVYYWYGEHKTTGRSGNRAHVGVRVYTSTELVNWTNAGVALAVSDDSMSEIIRGCTIERPKVLYNDTTGKFVMWFHLELKDHAYRAARTGCAIADAPTGPFEYLGSVRPNAGRYPIGITDNLKQRTAQPRRDPGPTPPPDESKKERADRFFVRDFYGGQMARDMNLFLDEDGTAYHVFASEENYTLNIAELDETFTKHTGRYARILPGEHREAPALFKRNGRYHLITSAATGWRPNAAQHAVADSIWGPWQITGNPCVGDDADLTFRSQSTFVLQVAGADDAFIFMADRWTPENPIDGRYIWLPIEFKNDRPVLKFSDTWSPQQRFGLDAGRR